MTTLTGTPAAPSVNLADARRREALRLAMNPIIPLLDDDGVIEIALNADGAIWAERVGQRMEKTSARMSKEEALRMLQLVASAMGVELSATNPSLAALVPGWETRLQAMVPPVVAAPTFTIRKPPRHVFTLADYVQRGIMTGQQAEALRESVRRRDNILVGGATGTGKTTLANAILHEIAVATTDRLYIVEDLRELQCAAPNKLQLFVQEPVYGWRRAIMDALRSRPDRIVVGELRSGAATLELVKAWNTGHPGGLATVHANHAAACLDRVCQLLEEVVPVAPRALIGQAINTVVHLVRDSAHPAGRRVSAMVRVSGCSTSNGWTVVPAT